MGGGVKMRYFRLGYFLLIWAPFYGYVPLLWLKNVGNPGNGMYFFIYHVSY